MARSVVKFNLTGTAECQDETKQLEALVSAMLELALGETAYRLSLLGINVTLESRVDKVDAGTDVSTGEQGNQ